MTNPMNKMAHMILSRFIITLGKRGKPKKIIRVNTMSAGGTTIKKAIILSLKIPHTCSSQLLIHLWWLCPQLSP
jgi:hypothetical protein